MEKRYDLIPQHGIQAVNDVLTSKLQKYNKNNWKYGLNWTDVLSNLKKHLTEFELGNDYNSEGLLHIAEVAAQALIIAEYYSIYPQGDDRVIAPINKPIIALDLDGVIFDFNSAYEAKFNVKMNDYWSSNYKLAEHLKELENDKEFWVNLKVLNKPTFEINYYVTSRSIPVEWIEESLEKNGLPCVPVHTVPWNHSKIETLKSLGVTLFIDDKFENYKEATNAGIFTYLMDAPHNQYYNVGHRRIFNLDKPLT